MTTEALKHPPQDEGGLSIKLPIEKLRTDGGTQPRAEMDLALVAEYAEDLKAGAVFPAIEVVYDGSDYWVIDGFHRKAAAKMAGLSEFGVSVTQGDLNHAVWLSLAANSRHGKRRSRQDTQRAIRTALQGWGEDKTDVAIAQHVGCASITVVWMQGDEEFSLQLDGWERVKAACRHWWELANNGGSP